MPNFVKIDNEFSPLMPMVLVGTATEGKANFMAAAWCVRVNGEPPMIGVSIGKEKITEEAIRRNNEFSVCVPGVDEMAKTDYCGIVAGNKVDKSGVFETFTRASKNMPLIAACPVNLECTLRQTVDLPDCYFFIGEITGAYALESVMENGKPAFEKTAPFVFTMDGLYRPLAAATGTAWKEGAAMVKK